jgi:sec-independent protein translocase protein TatA
MLSPVEIGVVAVVVVLLFGTRKLPELGSGLGKAISNFKRSYREASEIDVTPSEKGASVDDAKQGDPTGSGS